MSEIESKNTKMHDERRQGEALIVENNEPETVVEEPVKEEPVIVETENSQLIIVDEIHVSQ